MMTHEFIRPDLAALQLPFLVWLEAGLDVHAYRVTWEARPGCAWIACPSAEPTEPPHGYLQLRDGQVLGPWGRYVETRATPGSTPIAPRYREAPAWLVAACARLRERPAPLIAQADPGPRS